MLRILPFGPGHYDDARELWLSTRGVGLSSADGRAEIGRFLARNPGLSLVAFVGGRLVATILVGHDGRRGLIHHLAVAEADRRQGLARRLVRLALRGLNTAGIAKCHVMAFEDNAGGRAFWVAVGAEHRDDLRLYSLATDGPAAWHDDEAT